MVTGRRTIIEANQARALILAFLAIFYSLPVGFLPALAEDDEVAPLQYSIAEVKDKSSDSSSTDGSETSAKSANAAQKLTIAPERINALFSKLPALPVDSKKKFVIPEDSLIKPPLVKGDTVSVFTLPLNMGKARGADQASMSERPPQATVNPNTVLKVTRISPEGQTSPNSEISIEFSEPMIALGQEINSASSKFASLTPQQPGLWQWDGTQTLIFNSSIRRLPMATDFRLRVPAGIRSLDRHVLTAERQVSFRTDTVQVTSFNQDNKVTTTTPRLELGFNQFINPQVILTKTKVKVGNVEVPVQLTPNQNFEVSASGSQSAIAFEPIKPLPTNSKVDVYVEGDLPSAEGPLAGCAESHYTFRTYAPLQLTRKRCEGLACDPPDRPQYQNSSRINIQFNNIIDTLKFQKNWVRISPPVEDLEVLDSNSRSLPYQPNNIPRMPRFDESACLEISGKFEPFKRYKITFGKDVQDIYGQSLGSDQSVLLDVKNRRPGVGEGEFKILGARTEKRYKIWVQGAPYARVTIYRVKPEDWGIFHKKRFEGSEMGSKLAQLNYAISTKGRELDIDLTPYLKHNCGQLMVICELPRQYTSEEKEAARANAHTTQIAQETGMVEYSPRRSCWIECTALNMNELGIQDALVLVTDDVDGKPLAGVTVKRLDGKDSSVTDEKGLAHLDIGWKMKPSMETALNPQAYMDHFFDNTMIAVKGDDSCILTPSGTYQRMFAAGLQKEYLWYAVSDLPLYRPGQNVKIKGWVRRVENADEGKRLLNFPAVKFIHYVFSDASTNSILKGQMEVDETGGFSLDLPIPDKAQLGAATVNLSTTKPEASTPGQLASVTARSEVDTEVKFNIQEFKRPEFQITVNKPAQSLFVGNEPVILEAHTKYLAGGVLSGAPARWTVSTVEAGVTPENWPDYGFYNKYSKTLSEKESKGLSTAKTYTGTTDSDGVSKIKISTDKIPLQTAVTYNCEATVTDLNNQQWSERTSFVVVPDKTNLGIAINSNSYEPDSSVELKIIACDWHGKLRAGKPILIRWRESDAVNSDSYFQTTEQSLVSTDKPSIVTFKPSSKSKEVLAEVSLNDGSALTTTGSYKLSQQTKPAVEAPSVELTTDKANYKPGDIAHIHLKTNLVPAYGVLNFEREEIFATLPLHLTKSEETFDFAIKDGLYPGINLHAFVTRGGSDRADSNMRLSIPPLQRQLHLTAKSDNSNKSPGAPARIDIAVADQEGKAVADTQVALTVVDKAVLVLSPAKWPDILERFYPITTRSSSTRQERHQYTGLNIQVSNGRIGGSSQPPNPFLNAPTTLRSNFTPQALFKAALKTNQDGKATVDFKLPDNVTNYAVLALAAAGSDKFGQSESAFTTRLPLVIKPSPPRFLNLHDRFDLPIVIRNTTDKALQAEVVMRASNCDLIENAKVVTVPANGRAEVSFAAVASTIGKAYFQCVAVAGEINDAAQFDLPVQVPVSRLSTAAYGSLNATQAAARQQITLPAAVEPAYGGLTISTSSTVLQCLSDAYKYLRTYSYDCSEQISSRLLAMLSLKDMTAAFGLADQAEKAAIENQINDDIETLQKRNGPGGGFGLWSASDEHDIPFVSLQVANALRLAEAQHYRVDKGILNYAVNYLRTLESNPTNKSNASSSDFATRAYALHVRHLMKEDDSAAAARVIADWQTLTKEATAGHKPPQLSTETAAWLLPVVARDKTLQSQAELLRRLINNCVKQTASTACTTYDGYNGQDYLIFASGRRADAAVLEALLEDQPDSALIPKLANNLLLTRKNGIWSGTQENSYALCALAKYFALCESETPDFSSQSWLGNTLVAKQKFSGRSLETETVLVPTRIVASKTKGQTADIIVSKTGPGRLYYRVAMDFVPKELQQKAADHGFEIERTYEGVDDKNDAVLTKDGTWHFKSGAAIKAKVHFKTRGQRYHVVMNAPLPAGVEILNAALLGHRTQSAAATIDASSDASRFRRWSWYEHVNLRDAQVEAFSTILWPGSYDYEYVVQVTTPGHYLAAPAKVQEMYASETNGSSQTESIVVE
ncbi:MAG: hypothetical protein KGS72_09860 [Cyanobacteria bacterium REEB67]|nr:hypothetical protein [Cyanobacteria bacterium REEB67]